MLFVWTSCSAEGPSAADKAMVRPFLLPKDHPIKPKLDALFGSTFGAERATFSLETLEKAGFAKATPRKFTKLIVTRHDAFPGYIFKLYLDTQRYRKGMAEHHYWILRVRGAQKVSSIIASAGLEAQFKVPTKWIYALPKHPKPSKSYYPKYFILVEDDMFLLKDADNKSLWRSDYVTLSLLQSLHFILKQAGLYDCAKPDNIPFSYDGRIAFIDTETFDHETVDWDPLIPYLSAKNKAYWKSLDE